MFRPEYESIRPYLEAEIPAAMKRIATSEHFPLLCSFVFEGASVEEVKKMVEGIRTTAEFQERVMKAFNESIIRRTLSVFSCHGLEHLEPHESYLFVSNHRDIVLDSSLLQYALYQSGLPTTDITFGANLMTDPLVVDIGRANKMFRIERPTGRRDMIDNSRLVSGFIRDDVERLHRSVWIAQRNGRTKDGNDATDPGLLKMLAMTGEGTPAQRLDALRIVPVTVSYEWEPCDGLKVCETLKRRASGQYVKRPGEDLHSILTGLLQAKGRMEINVAPPLTFSDIDSSRANDFFRSAAKRLDCRILSGYRLFGSNLAAAGSPGASDDDRRAFERHCSLVADRYCGCEFPREDFLEALRLIYANPVKAKERI